jgi:class 3 adenylate cyclase
MSSNDRAEESGLPLHDDLKGEVARLATQNRDLEMLLDHTTAHSTYVEAELERTVQELQEERSKLRAEQAVSERLLLNILPKTIADRLKLDNQVIAESFSDASVLFADIAGFTSLSSRFPAEELVGWLNGIFSIFDGLTDQYGLEKIKTIGDSYMAVGGLPIPRGVQAG